MGAPWKEKEWWEKWWDKSFKEGGREKGEKELKDGKEKEGTKEVYKEFVGKEGSKDTSKGESKDDVETHAFVHPLAALYRRVAVLEAALGIGAPFIAKEERPEVGGAAVSQPLDRGEE